MSTYRNQTSDRENSTFWLLLVTLLTKKSKKKKRSKNKSNIAYLLALSVISVVVVVDFFFKLSATNTTSTWRALSVQE